MSSIPTGDGIDERVPSVLHDLDRAAWCLAAIVSAMRSGDPAAVAVVDNLGLGVPGDDSRSSWLESAAAAPLLQASRVIMGAAVWEQQDDEALLAQGRTSAAAGPMFATGLLSQLPDGERLLTEPTTMLDVGVGVAAMAISICQHLPNVSIVGLDVLPRPLELARAQVDAAGLAGRIDLRQLDVAALPDTDAFDLAWLPAPFIPPAPLEAGLERVMHALRPGGWVLLGHGRLDGDSLDVAVTRFKTVAYGGTPLDDDEAEALLRAIGLVDATTLSTPPGAPRITVARRPA